MVVKKAHFTVLAFPYEVGFSPASGLLVLLEAANAHPVWMNFTA
jgi:hypothetical protein